MNDRTRTDLKSQWLLTLLLCAGFAGLRAQCVEAPVLAQLPVANRACQRLAEASLAAFPSPESRCFRTDAATGRPLAGTLSTALRTALLAGGGIPVATSACGGAVEICVEDQFPAGTGNGCSDTIRVIRTYTARNTAPQASPAPASSAQQLFFLRPQLAVLQAVPVAIYVVPDNGQGTPVNPAPRPQDYPVFGNAQLHLAPASCNYTVTYQDGVRNAGCGNNFTFVRTFQVIDGCGDQDNRVFTQVVKVGDQETQLITPPLQVQNPLQFPVNTGCSAVIDTRLTGLRIADICDGSSALSAYVYLDAVLSSTPLGPYAVFGPNPQPFTDPLPVGQHLIRYVGQDSYGATTTLDIDFAVVDATPPNVRCLSTLRVVLGTNGQATLSAADLDAGSSDDCSSVTLSAALAGGTGQAIGRFASTLVFDCGATGDNTVLLQATDATGVNSSRCLTLVTVVDENAPSCVAPPSTGLTCRTFADNLPTDISNAFAADPEGIGTLLNDNFGRPATTDNCDSLAVRQLLLGSLNACGSGRLVRRFIVNDGAGFTQAGLCQQIIDVRSYVEYSLRLPGDQNYTCAELPTPEDLLIGAGGCDLIAITTHTDTLENNSSACYQLRLTHEIINWCEYNGVSDFIDIPRDADGDGNLQSTTFVNILPAGDATLADDRAFLDRDAVGGNGNEIRALIPAYGSSGRRGAFRYVQNVSVTDNEAPVAVIPEPENGQTITDDCLGGVILNFTATDDCVAPTTRIDLDVDVADLNGDGLFGRADFQADRSVPANRFSGSPATGVQVLIRLLPIGRHLARVRTADACGNEAEQYVVLNISDQKAPTPDCRTVSEVNLVPDVDLGGIATVFATDFIAGPPAVCTQAPISYSIYPEAVAGQAEFIPRAGQNMLSFDCGDVGEQILRVYAFSAANGLHDFCNISLTIEAADTSLCADRQGSLSGLILTEGGEPMAGVEVYLEGAAEAFMPSEIDGSYLFDGLREGSDYSIRPYYNEDPINGLSTFDISEISRYLLGEDIGLTAYQFIAADANNSGAVTILDLLEIRGVLLGIEDNFDNNTSWRFVPADYVFPLPANPWAEAFPEAAVFPELAGNAEADFVAIKVGDINGSARAAGSFRSGRTTSSGRSLREATLQLRTDTVASGKYALVLAGGTPALGGLQFSLQLPAGAEVTAGWIPEEAFVVDRNNVVHLSYVPENGETVPASLPMLSIRFTGLPSGELLGNGRLQPEGYDGDGQVLRLQLATTTGGDSLPQATVFPNPVSDRAMLAFAWPADELITLLVSDNQGRQVQQRAIFARAGDNRTELSRTSFGNRSGVYFVRLQGNNRQESLKVIVR